MRDLLEPCDAAACPAVAAMQALADVNKSIMTAVIDFNGSLCSRMAALNGERACKNRGVESKP